MHPTWAGVGEGEGGIFQENSIETCILSKARIEREDISDDVHIRIW